MPAVARGAGFVVTQTCAGGHEVEHLDDLGAETSGEAPVTAYCVLSGHAALLVCGGSQRQPGGTEQPVVRRRC